MMAHDLTWARDCAYVAVALIVLGLGFLFRSGRRMVYLFTEDQDMEPTPITTTFTPRPAPASPLNLQFGIVYAPRLETPPFVGYRCLEVAPDDFAIDAFDADGGTVEVYRTRDLFEAYRRFAEHLRMTVISDPEHVRTDVPARSWYAEGTVRRQDPPLPPAADE